jgi:HSP20 family protein
MQPKDLLPWNWHKKNVPSEVAEWEAPRSLRREMDAMMDDLFSGRGMWRGWPALRAAEEHFLPALDVQNRADAVSVKLELPGMEEKDIQISIDDDVLVIRGEKRSEMEDTREGARWSECHYGAFERGIPLPADLDLDAVRATFKKGVLTVDLPKLESARESGERVIEVESS